MNRTDPPDRDAITAERPVVMSREPMAPRQPSAPARWQPSWLLRQHLTAFVLAVLLPAIIRSAVGPVLGYDNGFVAFVAMVLGAVLGLAAVVLYLWWTYHAWQHADAATEAPLWTLGDGPYEITRNPCYLAVAAIVLSQALWLPTIWLALYALAVCAGLHARVFMVEEAELARRFGNQFNEYHERVPRWLPWHDLIQFTRELFVTAIALVRHR
jgi:protein-S-isoprenylcysteine O-methyltransferase Ste14